MIILISSCRRSPNYIFGYLNRHSLSSAKKCVTEITEFSLGFALQVTIQDLEYQGVKMLVIRSKPNITG